MMFRDYLKAVTDLANRGDAREESLYAVLAGLLEQFAAWPTSGFKDRRERELDLDDIKTYCRIITALHHTIDLQEEIDALYPDVEAEIVEIDK